jgi:predicted flap endonuclease-1-like 5' DNA nuclease
MWESAGRQAGRAMEYWLAAEREVRTALGAAAGTIMPLAAEKAEPRASSSAGEVPATETEPPATTTGKTAYKIERIEGIGLAYASQLAAVGIETTGDLLDRCSSAEGREDVAEKAGLSAKQLLKWTNMADLMRISGIGGEYAELLEASGVDTVKELRTRNAETLAATMAEINATKKLTRRVASAKQVAKWVDQAKSLDPMITY